jgi:hypothetical protein
MSSLQARIHVGAIMAYVVVALIFAWPLPLHMSTHLTGAPSGDTGVYVWNQWVFQHELLDHHRSPYFTPQIFSTTGSPANLSLHNYTTFQNLLAIPLTGPLGIVATFNVVFLLMCVTTAYATFLLAKHVTGTVAESWLAGLVFAWSPLLVTRGTGHFSMVAAAPLAVFLLLLLKASTRDWRLNGVGMGVVIAWAACTDVYYGVYCLLIGLMFLLGRVVSVQRVDPTGRSRTLLGVVSALTWAVAALVGVVALGAGGEVAIMGVTIRVHSLYTPMLVFAGLLLARVALRHGIVIARPSGADFYRCIRIIATAGVTAGVLLSPLLYAVAARLADGRFDADTIYWRSSPAGVDVLALVTPNPNHPFAADWLRAWLRPQSEAYLEAVVSLSLVGLAILVLAWARGWRPSSWWVTLSLGFGFLALGPFVHIAGANTFFPGPWALLRYVPFFGLTRTPGRFAVVLTLGFAVLVASALASLGRTYPRRRAQMLAAAGVLMAFELLPAPRTLYSAAIPVIYARVASQPGDLRVLQLPFGIRDGTSSAGNFNARTMYFQTFHGKPLIGGYLSRVSERRFREVRHDETLDALILLSEGAALSPAREARFIGGGSAFVERARIGFVVMDRGFVPDPYASLVRRAFRLELVETDGPFELYRPTSD